MRWATPDSVTVWHSQMTITCQPKAFKALALDWSRDRFDNSFLSQYSTLVDGIDARLHPWCWCQKHPFTRMIFLREGKTKSGRPGKAATCRRYLYPME